MTEVERGQITELLALFSILEIRLSNERHDPVQVEFLCQGLRTRVKTEAKAFGVKDADLQLAIKELM